MRVGVNTLFLVPERAGGAEVYLRQVLDAMQRLEPDLELVLFTNRENHPTFPGYRRVPLGVSGRAVPLRVLAEQRSLVRAAAAEGLDLLFSPCYTGPIRPPCPHVLTIHDANFLDMPEDFLRPILAADRWLIRRCAEASRLVLTVSEFSRGRIIDGLGLSPERVLATPEAASPVFAEPRPRVEGKPFLLYVANTYVHKNAQRLVRAFSRIADRIPHDLIIVGRVHRGEPPRHPRVRRLRRVSFDELVRLYQSCDLFVFPSRYEGFGLPVLEALCAGARVAAARAAAIPEVAGEAATYFDPLDEGSMATTILEVLGEPADRRARFRELGRQRVRQFSWERCALATLQGFRRALTGPGTGD